MANKQNIAVALLQCNEGQIEGLPRNPRFIKDERFKKLVKSLQDDPEMLDLRELIVYPHGKHFVVIGGNMRLRAGKELGFETMPCKILPADTPIEKLKAYVIKDNNAFGNDDFDLLANEWGTEFLEDCGMEFGFFKEIEEEAQEVEQKVKGKVPFTEVLNEEHNYIVLYFDNEVDWLQAETLFELERVKALSTRNDGQVADNMQRIGVGRVLNGAKALNKLLKQNEH